MTEHYDPDAKPMTAELHQARTELRELKQKLGLAATGEVNAIPEPITDPAPVAVPKLQRELDEAHTRIAELEHENVRESCTQLSIPWDNCPRVVKAETERDEAITIGTDAVTARKKAEETHEDEIIALRGRMVTAEARLRGWDRADNEKEALRARLEKAKELCPDSDQNLIVFEGCDVCAIAPEDIEALREALEEISKLVAAGESGGREGDPGSTPVTQDRDPVPTNVSVGAGEAMQPDAGRTAGLRTEAEPKNVLGVDATVSQRTTDPAPTSTCENCATACTRCGPLKRVRTLLASARVTLELVTLTEAVASADAKLREALADIDAARGGE